MSPGLASHLSLSLDESQEGQATAWENILQHDDEGQNDKDGENGAQAIKHHVDQIDFVGQTVAPEWIPKLGHSVNIRK